MAEQVALLTIPEVAALAKVSRRQVDRWIAAKALRAIWVSPRSPRVHPRDFDAFLATRRRV